MKETPTKWDKKTIEMESDIELCRRLESMSTHGEVEGRAIALQEAAKRLKRYSMQPGISWSP